MAKKQKTSWFTVIVSVLLLVSMFAAAVFYIQKETKIVIADESYGSLEMIPIVSATENGGISMKMRYITVRKNVNIFDHIYENEETAVMDQNHTTLYFMERVNETENTHLYKLHFVEPDTERSRSDRPKTQKNRVADENVWRKLG